MHFESNVIHHASDEKVTYNSELPNHCDADDHDDNTNNSNAVKVTRLNTL